MTLEHELLSYAENEQGKVKDTIEKRDMLSVEATTDSRCVKFCDSTLYRLRTTLKTSNIFRISQ